MFADASRVQSWRNDTPGTAKVVHLNNAGASLMPQQVFDAVTHHLRDELLLGGYEMATAKKAELEELYALCAQLIGAASPSEIAILESATQAWASAFYSIPFKPGDVYLTCTADYGANFVAALQVAQRRGILVVEVQPNEHGEVCLADLQAKLAEHGASVKCVAITHIPTNSGLVNPCEEIGRLVKTAGVPYYLVDACQSVGQMPIDVEKLHCDMLSATSRKYLRGPRGVGFLYVRGSVLESLDPITIDHYAAPWTSRNTFQPRPDARRFEKWESSIANRMGLRAAVSYALAHADPRSSGSWDRIQQLAALLREKLAALPGVHVRDLGRTKCGIVTFTVDGLKCPDVQQTLCDRFRINVSYSTPAASRLDMERRGLEAVLRASVHYFNVEEDLTALCDALRTLIMEKFAAESSKETIKGVPAPPLQVQPQHVGARPGVARECNVDRVLIARFGLLSASLKVIPPYAVVLNQTNVSGNNNKFYVIQVILNSSSGQYSLFSRWGRVGEDGQSTIVDHGNDKAAAISSFERKFQDKTGNPFSAIASGTFINIAGKYSVAQAAATFDEFSSSSGAPHQAMDDEAAVV